MTTPIGRRELGERELHAIGVRAEMAALALIVQGFEDMPDEARARTLRYLTDRYAAAVPPGMRPPAAPRPSERS